MGKPRWAPEGVDTETPHPARIYDYLLDGMHNFAVDREAAERLLELDPYAKAYAWANRTFLKNTVRHAVAAGIRQFLDLGSGIPTVGNVHEVAQALSPDCRICYVDHDPVAVAHSRLILDGNPRVGVVQADIRDPASVLNDPVVAELLDFSQPVAVMFVAVLHFVPDTDDPAGLIRQFGDVVASGSWLIVSHLSNDEQDFIARRAIEEYKARTGVNLVSRTPEQVEDLLGGDWQPVEPGLINVPFWRPDQSFNADSIALARRVPGLAIVARRP